MTREFLYDYINSHKLAVIASVNQNGDPESAVIGIAVTKELEVIFDTVRSSSKCHNLLKHPRVSFVIGRDDESTIQYEGTAKQLDGQEGQLKELYYSAFPDGRDRAATWPGLVYFKVSPRWIRYSNFNAPQVIDEITFDQ